MAYKEREKPRILCIYEALAKRMKLGPGDQYYLLHMDGGFVGDAGCAYGLTRFALFGAE